MNRINRHQFIKTSALASASSLSLPLFSIGKGGGSANSKLNIAFIGAGGISNWALEPSRAENIVALCDIDETKFDEHRETVPEIAKARRFTDFRVMLDKMENEIDAVSTMTPSSTP